VIPAVFCGGDMVPAVRSVSDAIGAGKRAAIGIDILFKEREITPSKIIFGKSGGLSFAQYLDGIFYPTKDPVPFENINLEYFKEMDRVKILRKEIPDKPEDLGFGETVLGLDRQQAVEEASRCFGCGFCNECGNCYIFCPDIATFFVKQKGFQIDYDYCKGCGICVRECPRGVILQTEETQ
jgi:ferredoxin